MSAPRTSAPAPLAPVSPDVAPRSASAPDGGSYGTIVVVGGGCYGSYYVRQLARARERGAIAWRRLVVVDRDAGCQVTREGLAMRASAVWHDAHDAHDTAGLGEALEPHAPARLAVAEWREFFDGFLGAAAANPSTARDAIVPSPLMPHLMFEWLLARARQRWPDRVVEQRPLAAPPGTPWEQRAPDGTHYASYATWMCPVNCVEPETCPHTRGPRDWSMPRGLAAFVQREAAAGRPLVGPAILHCTHRAFGVGMFDVSAVVAADALVREAGTAGPAQVLIGTTSHCHGALAVLSVSAPEE